MYINQLSVITIIRNIFYLVKQNWEHFKLDLNYLKKYSKTICTKGLLVMGYLLYVSQTDTYFFKDVFF